MNVGRAAGDLHSLQHPDVPLPSLTGTHSVRVFLVAAADSEGLHVRAASSDPTSTQSSADDGQLLLSCEENSRLDAFALTRSASASES